jgi:hypothetical protein
MPEPSSIIALTGEPLLPRAPEVPLTRTAFAAAHVISDPLAERSPWDTPPAVDWDATLAFRQGLWDQGLGLAEAMDTAQRGMGVDWETALELIRRTMQAARAHPLKPRVACGAGTDHLGGRRPDRRRRDHRSAYRADGGDRGGGGQIILMATRALPAIGAEAGTYARVYDTPYLAGGGAGDPALAGRDVRSRPGRLLGRGRYRRGDSDFVLDLIARNAAKVDGIKISLLDQAMRRRFAPACPRACASIPGTTSTTRP